MLAMEILLGIIALVWAVLNIILFFKLWGACDNIKRIADKYDPEGKAARECIAKERKGISLFSSKEDIEKWLNEGK